MGFHSFFYSQNCGTPWVFMTDVDIIPRPNSSYALNEFYNSVRSKCHKYNQLKATLT